MQTSTVDLWETITIEAERESSLWHDALRSEPEREGVAVFSTLCDDTYALGLETIYEGYLLHYGRPRLFAPADSDTEQYAALFRHLLDRGIYMAPSQFECMFVSVAHGDDEIDRTIEAVGDFFDS